MKKLLYIYSNGIEKIHNDFISKTTLKRESKNSKTVSIYKINIDLYQELKNKQYITTLVLN